VPKTQIISINVVDDAVRQLMNREAAAAEAVDNVAVLPDGDGDGHGNGMFDGLYDRVDDSFDGGEEEETANMLDFELKRYRAVMPLRMLIRNPVNAKKMIHSDPLKWWCEQEHNFQQ
jgi:hypothetical protein